LYRGNERYKRVYFDFGDFAITGCVVYPWNTSWLGKRRGSGEF
jgi:hypothetical protein